MGVNTSHPNVSGLNIGSGGISVHTNDGNKPGRDQKILLQRANGGTANLIFVSGILVGLELTDP